jgi:hypothetical protein
MIAALGQFLYCSNSILGFIPDHGDRSDKWAFIRDALATNQSISSFHLLQ